MNDSHSIVASISYKTWQHGHAWADLKVMHIIENNC